MIDYLAILYLAGCLAFILVVLVCALDELSSRRQPRPGRFAPIYEKKPWETGP